MRSIIFFTVAATKYPATQATSKTRFKPAVVARAAAYHTKPEPFSKLVLLFRIFFGRTHSIVMPCGAAGTLSVGWLGNHSHAPASGALPYHSMQPLGSGPGAGQ